jgi:hypothetical protein
MMNLSQFHTKRLEYHARLYNILHPVGRPAFYTPKNNKIWMDSKCISNIYRRRFYDEL